MSTLMNPAPAVDHNVADLTEPFLCRVAKRDDTPGALYQAQVLKHRGVGYVPAPIASGCGPTPETALNALSLTLHRNDWHKSYYPWPALIRAIETERGNAK